MVSSSVMESHPYKGPLCKACSNINLRLVAQTDFENDHGHYQHITNSRDLLLSFRNCLLCKVFLAHAAFIHIGLGFMKDDEDIGDHLLPLPLELGAIKSTYIKDPDDERLHLTGLETGYPFSPARLPFKYPRYKSFHLIATLESPAAFDIDGRPGLRSWDSDETYKLLLTWLEQCVCNHSACSRSLSGEYVNDNMVRLPKRVLDVGSENGNSDVRLIQTNDFGKYVALSHCWGPPDKKPVETRKGNLQEHFKGIQFELLPKTFQDAAKVTKSLGLRYLWIDSLCIIHDHDDWRQEAENMDQIYRNAYITLGASDAKDSTVGLFVERADFFSVEVPYITVGGGVAGSFYIRPLDRLDYVRATDPLLGPLSSRAWCMQELLLSRRFVFFTKGGLIWCCRSYEITETQHTPRSRIRAIESSWISIVDNYSKRSLTFSKDRLLALRGLANEIQRSRPNDTYAFGMWVQDLPFQLLWFQSGLSAEENLTVPLSLEIPSWSWASRIGHVSFLEIFRGSRPFFIAEISFELPSTITIIAPTENMTYCKGSYVATNDGFRGRIIALPMNWRQPNSRWQTSLGLSTRKQFNEIIEWICPVPCFLFGFSERRTCVIVDRNNEVIGFCTLDEEPSDDCSKHKLYICAPTVAVLCHIPGWAVFYVLILEYRYNLNSPSEDINHNPLWVRVGIGFVITDSWFLREGAEHEGFKFQKIVVVSHDPLLYGNVYYPFMCGV